MDAPLGRLFMMNKCQNEANSRMQKHKSILDSWYFKRVFGEVELFACDRYIAYQSESDEKSHMSSRISDSGGWWCNPEHSEFYGNGNCFKVEDRSLIEYSTQIVYWKMSCKWVWA